MAPSFIRHKEWRVSRNVWFRIKACFLTFITTIDAQDMLPWSLCKRPVPYILHQDKANLNYLFSFEAHHTNAHVATALTAIKIRLWVSVNRIDQTSSGHTLR